MVSFGCESMGHVETLNVSLRGAKNCNSKTMYLYQRNTISTETVRLTSSQDSDITQVISDLTDNPEIIYKNYLRRLKELLNQTVVRNTGYNEFKMVEHEQYDQSEISDIGPLFKGSKIGPVLKIMDSDEYSLYLKESSQIFFNIYVNKQQMHVEIQFLYMSIILSHMLSSQFTQLKDDKKYDDLIKKHKQCFLETKNYVISKVLGEISVPSERYFAIKNFFITGTKDYKLKNELLKTINIETINMFNFLKLEKKKWTVEEEKLNSDHATKYEIVYSDLQTFFKSWNNLSNELFRKGFRYLFGSFLIPAINNNTCSQVEINLYNEFFNLEKNKNLTHHIYNELKKLEQGQYNLLAEQFKKVDLINKLENQIKVKKNVKRDRDFSVSEKIEKKNRTIEVKGIADPVNSNMFSASIKKTVVDSYAHEKSIGNDKSSENSDVGAIVKRNATDVSSNNHQVDTKVNEVLHVKSNSNGNETNASDTKVIDDSTVINNGNETNASDTKVIDDSTVINNAKNESHESFEEEYYNEIFSYMTDVRYVEEQLQGCDINDLLKVTYKYWNSRNISKEIMETKLMTRFKIDISYKSLNGLMYDNWIRDDIINCMTEVINLMFFCISDPNESPPVHCWTTFFFAKLFENKVYDYNFVKKWTKKMDTFAYKKIFFPINISNNHWTLVYCKIDSQQRNIEIYYYDSFGPQTDFEKYCLGIKFWFESEFQKRNMVNQYSYIIKDKSIKQQYDSCNCGLIVIQNIIHLAFNRNIKVYKNPQELSKLRSLTAFICTDKEMLTLTFVSNNKLNLDIIEKDMMKNRDGSSLSLKSIQGQTPIEIDRDSLIDLSISHKDILGQYSDKFVSFDEYYQLLKLIKSDLRI